MDYYKCENCGEVFDEFEMEYSMAQNDKKCWCESCRNKEIKQGINKIKKWDRDTTNWDVSGME